MKNAVLVMAIAAMVSACGGGGGGGDTASGAQPAAANLQGFWATQDKTAVALITPAGETWVITANGYGVSKLVATENGNSFSATGNYYSDKAPAAVSGSGTFAAKSKFDATIVHADGSKSAVSAVYDVNYDKAASLAAVAGTYIDAKGGLYTVGTDGKIQGAMGRSNGCTISGSVTPDSSGKNFYRLILKEGNEAACPLAGASFTGVLASPVIYNGKRHALGGIISDKQYGEAIGLIER